MTLLTRLLYAITRTPRPRCGAATLVIVSTPDSDRRVRATCDRAAHGTRTRHKATTRQGRTVEWRDAR